MTMRASGCLLVTLVSLALAGPAPAQVDLTTFVQLGDSLTAGYMDGCWGEFGQRRDFGAVIAARVGVAFEQPLLKDPGIGSGLGPGRGCLVLTSLAPTFSNRESTLVPLNAALPRAYNNLAVPGYTTADVVDTRAAAQNGNPLTDVVLRGRGTALEQAVSLNPTFVTVWIGSNDFLRAATTGTAIDQVSGEPFFTMTDLDLVTRKMVTIVDTLKARQGGRGKGIFMTLPDPTLTPFVSTISPILTTLPNGTAVTVISARHQKVDGIPTGVTGGPAGVPSGSKLTLFAGPLLAQGFGIPCGILAATDPRRANCDKPLPDDVDLVTGQPGVVLYPDEVRAIQDRIEAVNELIFAIAPTAGFKVFDTNAALQDVKTNGRDIAGIRFNADFLVGGVYSLDGIHPSALGHALLADELIQFMNKPVVDNPRPDEDAGGFGTHFDRIDFFAVFSNLSRGTSLVGLGPLGEQAILQAATGIFTPDLWPLMRNGFALSGRLELPVDGSDRPERGVRKPGALGGF